MAAQERLMLGTATSYPSTYLLTLYIILRIHLTVKGERKGCSMMKEKMLVKSCTFRSCHIVYLALESERKILSVGSER